MNKLFGLQSALRIASRGTPQYRVADVAPNTHKELLQCYNETGKLVVWSGGSPNTIWRDANSLFRAWHDWCHIQSGMCDKVDCFTVARECEVADFQCIGLGDMLARVIQIEVAEQALYYGETGKFVEDQVEFTLRRL